MPEEKLTVEELKKKAEKPGKDARVSEKSQYAIFLISLSGTLQV
ncbi:MAG: hypothetical protein ACXABD_22860 [Candidatus Thorarchaeota archaeon]|jgi:hypothetical protein